MRRVFPILAAALLSACGKLVDVNVTVVDQKTALENQILGTYEELGNEMLLLASVRSVDDAGRLKAVAATPPGKMKAIKAMQRMEFNRDDIQQFKQLGCAGEGNDGFLKFLETDKTKKDPRFGAFVQTLIGEENADRQAILDRIIATTANFTEADMPRVKKIYAGLNRDNAKPGETIQQDDGAWIQKPKP
jgi:uncharacterized protein YdbL (DUF1318 family)